MRMHIHEEHLEGAPTLRKAAEIDIPARLIQLRRQRQSDRPCGYVLRGRFVEENGPVIAADHQETSALQRKCTRQM
jgi:hypothetical protein